MKCAITIFLIIGCIILTYNLYDNLFNKEHMLAYIPPSIQANVDEVRQSVVDEITTTQTTLGANTTLSNITKTVLDDGTEVYINTNTGRIQNVITTTTPAPTYATRYIKIYKKDNGSLQELKIANMEVSVKYNDEIIKTGYSSLNMSEAIGNNVVSNVFDGYLNTYAHTINKSPYIIIDIGGEYQIHDIILYKTLDPKDSLVGASIDLINDNNEVKFTTNIDKDYYKTTISLDKTLSGYELIIKGEENKLVSTKYNDLTHGYFDINKTRDCTSYCRYIGEKDPYFSCVIYEGSTPKEIKKNEDEVIDTACSYSEIVSNIVLKNDVVLALSEILIYDMNKNLIPINIENVQTSGTNTKGSEKNLFDGTVDTYFATTRGKSSIEIILTKPTNIFKIVLKTVAHLELSRFVKGDSDSKDLINGTEILLFNNNKEIYKSPKIQESKFKRVFTYYPYFNKIFSQEHDLESFFTNNLYDTTTPNTTRITTPSAAVHYASSTPTPLSVQSILKATTTATTTTTPQIQEEVQVEVQEEQTQNEEGGIGTVLIIVGSVVGVGLLGYGISTSMK